METEQGGQFLKLCEKELTKARNQAKTPEKKKLYSKALLLIGGLIAYGQEKNPKRGISPETFPAKEEQTGEMGSEAEGGEEGERARKSDRLYNIRMQIARMKDEGVKTLLLGRGRKTTLDELKKEAAELQQDLLNAGGRG